MALLFIVELNDLWYFPQWIAGLWALTGHTMAPLHKICVWKHIRKIKRKPLMHDSDWFKLSLRLIFLICVQTQMLCNGAILITQILLTSGPQINHKQTIKWRKKWWVHIYLASNKQTYFMQLSLRPILPYKSNTAYFTSIFLGIIIDSAFVCPKILGRRKENQIKMIWKS